MTTAHFAADEISPAGNAEGSPAIFWLAAIVLTTLSAIVLYAAATSGELWLDEVWTITLMRNEVHSSSDIVLSLKHDNNHFLNSLIVYLIGPDGSMWDYRRPVVVAGTLSVFLAGWIQRRRGLAGAVAAM